VRGDPVNATSVEMRAAFDRSDTRGETPSALNRSAVTQAFLPFLLDTRGKFARPEMFDAYNVTLESPIFGQPAKDLVARFRRRASVVTSSI
jgi:hypothetical protein